MAQQASIERSSAHREALSAQQDSIETNHHLAAGSLDLTYFPILKILLCNEGAPGGVKVEVVGPEHVQDCLSIQDSL